MLLVRVVGDEIVFGGFYRVPRPVTVPASAWALLLEWVRWETDRYIDGFDDGRRQARDDLRRGDI